MSTTTKAPAPDAVIEAGWKVLDALGEPVARVQSRRPEDPAIELYGAMRRAKVTALSRRRELPPAFITALRDVKARRDAALDARGRP